MNLFHWSIITFIIGGVLIWHNNDGGWVFFFLSLLLELLDSGSQL